MIEAITKRSAGLDIHKMMVMATTLIESEEGELVETTKEFGTFLRDRRELVDWLKRQAIEFVVMESTGIYWKSIYESLDAAKIRVYVVNAKHVKQVPGRKTDIKDSQWLASLARFGLLKASFIPPKDLRELRLVARRYIKLTGQYAVEKNRLHKTLDDAGIRLGGVVTDINGVTAREIIRALIDGANVSDVVEMARGRLKKKIQQLHLCLEGGLTNTHRFVLREIVAHIDFLERQMDTLLSYLYTAMEESYLQQWQILQTIPGINATSAALIIVETGVDMEQFGTIRRMMSWAGICPGNNESAGKSKSGRTRKANQYLRRTLCEIANAAVRTRSQFQGKYRAMVIRRGHKRTIFAIGHKILRITYAMLKDGTPYKDPDIDYEALMVKRNAPRWIKALNTFGLLHTH